MPGRVTQEELDLIVLHTVASTTLRDTARDSVFRMTREIQELWRERAALVTKVELLSTPRPTGLPGSY